MLHWWRPFCTDGLWNLCHRLDEETLAKVRPGLEKVIALLEIPPDASDKEREGRTKAARQFALSHFKNVRHRELFLVFLQSDNVETVKAGLRGLQPHLQAGDVAALREC